MGRNRGGILRVIKPMSTPRKHESPIRKFDGRQSMSPAVSDSHSLSAPIRGEGRGSRRGEGFPFLYSAFEILRRRGFAQAGRRCLVAFLALLAVRGWGQPQTRQVPIERKHFRQILEYFGPPHEAQVKTMLSGSRAKVEPGGMIFMTDARLEMFDEKGALQATAETPECVFDTNTRFLCSTSHVKVVRLELQDSIEGDGFSWQQTNSWMNLSNNVLTVAHNVSRPE